jgi:hypothetical protein
MTPPTIEQIIETLMYQVVVILRMARTFFAMSLDAHFYSSLMYAAREHDTSAEPNLGRADAHSSMNR